MRLLRGIGIPSNRDDLRLLALKLRRKRRRCFIIGNGPSLNAGDLDLIAGEDSMACNRIYLIYPHTKWRPKYYFAVDPKVIKGIGGEIPMNAEITYVAAHVCVKFMPRQLRPIMFRELYSNGGLSGSSSEGDVSGLFHFSKNSLCGIEGGWASLYSALQLAYWLGYKEVVMLGVDHSFPKSVSQDPSHYIPDPSAQSHFADGYIQSGHRLDVPNLEMTTAAFKKAWMVYKASGRHLVNASRVTNLEGVPRENLEEVLKRSADGVNKS